VKAAGDHAAAEARAERLEAALRLLRDMHCIPVTEDGEPDDGAAAVLRIIDAALQQEGGE
jgi:hypothetical protein